MKYIQSLLILTISVLLLQSCEKSDPIPIDVIAVEQEFEVYPSQKLGADGLEIYLSIQAVEEDSCLNSVIDASIEIFDSKITVNINGIYEPEFCDEGVHIPKLDFLLPSEEKTYEIEFLKGELLSTSGTLSITENSVDLDIDNLGGVYIMEAQMFMIQDEFVWGYFIEDPASVGTNNDPLHFDEILSEFFEYVPDEESIPAGNYGYFKVEPNGDIVIPDLKESAVPVAFEIPEEVYWDKVTQALDNVIIFRPHLKFSFALGDGDVYTNL